MDMFNRDKFIRDMFNRDMFRQLHRNVPVPIVVLVTQ